MPTLPQRPHNFEMARAIANLSSGTLAALCGSSRHEDIDALTQDWTTAVMAPDAPTHATWQESWTWYASQQTEAVLWSQAYTLAGA